MNPAVGKFLDGLFFLAAALPIVISDIRTLRIPDRYLIAGVALVCMRRIVFAGDSSLVFLLNGLIGFAFLGAFWLFFRDKIGLGDAKFSGFIALLVGIPAWMFSLLLASISGILFIVVGIGRGTATRADRIPFAPFMAFGAVGGFLFQLLGGDGLYALS